MIGKTISHYKILEKIGGGGMGVVFKAEDTKLDRFVALKFLPPYLSTDETEKQRFIHEAKAASTLDHNSICTIHEIDETEDGQLFIVMAYYKGESVKEKIEGGQLDIEQALDIAINVAKGLARAHEANIIHRDIKPANIMITELDEVKIVDFGLAKLYGRTKLTKSGSTVGTTAYMSPEQARGEEVDSRTDIWSLGIILYEMLCGQLPFRGEFEQAIIYSIINEEPESLIETKPDTPPELEKIIICALQKDPQSRYSSINELLHELKDYRKSILGPVSEVPVLKSILRSIRKPRLAIPTVVVIIALCILSFWFLNHRAKIRWAREQAIPDIERLIGEANYFPAFKIALVAEKYIPQNPQFNALTSQIYRRVSIMTSPPGADIFVKNIRAFDNSYWQYHVQSPTGNLLICRGNTMYRIEKDGYETIERIINTVGPHSVDSLIIILDKKGEIPSGMVRVQGSNIGNNLLEDFFIDKYEVTNRQYKDFIDAGGFEDEKYWKHKFIKDGRDIPFKQVTDEIFVDRTGRPGPSTWVAGDYPEGHDNYPVGGVSWYEATAYAEFVGKSLPTTQHWIRAAGRISGSIIASSSNFNGKGPDPVGENPGKGPWGTYDMAGNVMEWCWNKTEIGRIIRGGHWDSPIYMYKDISQLPPFDRSPYNGIRCVQYLNREIISEEFFQPITYENPGNFYEEKPCSDEVFQVYKNLFSYDRTELNAHTEWINNSFPEWNLEKISFDAAYGDERVIAYLYLPKNTAPPYQTVIYFPGSGTIQNSQSENAQHDFKWRETIRMRYLVKNGRAAMFPIYKGTFDRYIDGITDSRGSEAGSPHKHLEWVIQVIKDFRRSIDYLEIRDDINLEKLAFFGYSWGGRLGCIIPVVEDRLKISILSSGGLSLNRVLDEVEEINYVTRVKIPTLMLNGIYDYTFPFEMSIKPMFDLLGTPPQHKLLKKYNMDHRVHFNEEIRESLLWLDRYFGKVR